MATILVVDDIADNVKLLEFDLLDLGYQVITAYSGREALDIVDRENVDCIMLDIMMPEMDGFQVCRHGHRIKPSNNNSHGGCQSKG